jgi:hypothetical protein
MQERLQVFKLVPLCSCHFTSSEISEIGGCKGIGDPQRKSLTEGIEDLETGLL